MDLREHPQPAAVPAPPRRATAGLVALAIGAFGIGLTEFVIAGLLTEVASDLDVSVPMAGGLVSGYALSVVVGAFTVTLALLRTPPKSALLILFGLFVAGNALSAWSPNYGVALAGRIVAALAHGGYFGIGAVLAAALVPRDRQASAIAIMFAGMTTANVLGVPAGTWLGQHAGWRATFVAISVVGVIAMAGIAWLVPSVPAPPTGRLREQFRVLRQPQLLASSAITILAFGGVFGAFTYIEPVLRDVSGFSAGAVPLLLVLFGVGLFVGNLVGGRAADHSVDGTLVVLTLVLPVVLAALALCAPYPIPTAVLLGVMGFVGFATVPPLQLRVLRNADGATTIASAANIAAFNLGNALGVVLGGAALNLTAAPVAPIWTGAALTAVGAIVTLLAVRPGKVSPA